MNIPMWGVREKGYIDAVQERCYGTPERFHVPMFYCDFLVIVLSYQKWPMPRILISLHVWVQEVKINQEVECAFETTTLDNSHVWVGPLNNGWTENGSDGFHDKTVIFFSR